MRMRWRRNTGSFRMGIACLWSESILLLAASSASRKETKHDHQSQEQDGDRIGIDCWNWPCNSPRAGGSRSVGNPERTHAGTSEASGREDQNHSSESYGERSS